MFAPIVRGAPIARQLPEIVERNAVIPALHPPIRQADGFGLDGLEGRRAHLAESRYKAA